MIINLNLTHLEELQNLSAKNGDVKDAQYWPLCFEQQNNGIRTLLGWQHENQIVAYVQFNRGPKYQNFLSANIPEIQDLRVDSAHQRQGIATSLIYACEALAVSEGFTHIGIGVGLSSDYGKAQKLYVSLGYIPDGAGVNYDRQPLHKGDRIILDDDLSLMMIKQL